MTFNSAGIVNGGSATITNNRGLIFSDSSTAGSATINNNELFFFVGNSTGVNAAITNNGFLEFGNSSTGGRARLINGAAGTIDLSTLTTAGMTAGSIEGAGDVFRNRGAIRA